MHQPSNRRRVWHSCHTHATLCHTSHRIHRIHRNDCRRIFSTDFTDAHRFLGCVFAPNLCTSVQSVGVFVGGYGILPYPRRPPRGCTCLKCTDQALVHQHCNPPTESHGIHRIFWRKYSPTDFTDAHRSLGCVVAS